MDTPLCNFVFAYPLDSLLASPFCYKIKLWAATASDFTKSPQRSTVATSPGFLLIFLVSPQISIFRYEITCQQAVGARRQDYPKFLFVKDLLELQFDLVLIAALRKG